MNLLKIKIIFITLLGLFIINSCKTTRLPPTFKYGTFKFKQRNDDVFLTSNFTRFLKSNPFCSIVLKVPSKQNTIVEEETFTNRSMYFAIEKTLIKNNFIVNDRTIFEKKFNSDSISKTKTDLILELVDFTNVNYYTNKVIPEGTADETENTLPTYFYFRGATAQFKITHIKTNEVVATFVLQYTPCTKGCKMKYFSNGTIEEIEGDFKARKKNGYESVDVNENYEMFDELAKRLVFELRKPRD